MRVAVVDPIGMGVNLPTALQRYGAEVVEVHSEFPDVHLAPGSSSAAMSVDHQGDVAATAATLKQLDVEFVTPGIESGVLLADALSEALGTPGNGMTDPLARRDKYLMACAVRAAGLPVAETITSSSATETGVWAERVGKWPVVLKPPSSAGTDNVIMCHTPAEVRAAHTKIMTSVDRCGLRNESVVAQQFLHGDEYFVNTVSRDGVHHLVEVWRYHKRPVDGGAMMYDYEHPVPAEAPGVAAIVEYTLGVLDALEIRNGAAHTEVMLTPDGPVLVESGARLGGSHNPEVVARAVGRDQVDALAIAIMQPERITGRQLPPYRIVSPLRYVTLICPDDGRVPDHDGFAAVRALPSFLQLVLTAPHGRPAPRTVDLATSPGYVYLGGVDEHQVEADYQRLRALEASGLYLPAAPPTERMSSS